MKNIIVSALIATIVAACGVDIAPTTDSGDDETPPTMEPTAPPTETPPVEPPFCGQEGRFADSELPILPNDWRWGFPFEAGNGVYVAEAEVLQVPGSYVGLVIHSFVEHGPTSNYWLGGAILNESVPYGDVVIHDIAVDGTVAYVLWTVMSYDGNGYYGVYDTRITTLDLANGTLGTAFPQQLNQNANRAYRMAIVAGSPVIAYKDVYGQLGVFKSYRQNGQLQLEDAQVLLIYAAMPVFVSFSVDKDGVMAFLLSDPSAKRIETVRYRVCR